MAKKKIVRRKKAPAPKKSPYTEIAWVRADGDVATCSCGRVSVEMKGTDLVIRSWNGWLQEGQWVTCGVSVKGTNGCLDRIRISPRVVWEAGSGDRYTIGKFLPEGEESRKVSP